MNWPADKIERRPITELIPYARNARTHTDQQVGQIAASIKEWGWTNPVLIDADGGIIAGHGRVMAAQKLGIKDIPVMVADGWSESKKKAYILADNQLALNAGWDVDMLTVEIAELNEAGFNLDLIGFDGDFLNDLLVEKTEGLTDADEIPDVQDDAVTVTGDIWILGNHRIRCGDSTSADDVAALLGTVKPHLMVTDPPYGVEYAAGWRAAAMPDKNDAFRWVKGGKEIGVVENDDRADWREAWALFPGDVAYVWHAGNKAHIVAGSLLESGFDLRAQIIWAKSQFVIGRGHYHPHHEPCWYAVKNKGHWSGDRKQSTLWQIDKPRKSETGHSTQKPVECMRRPIVNNSSPGQAVYEPFSGSGTTIIAGEMEARHIYAMELSPNYVDVAVRRWQEFTGKDAVLESTGQTFKEVEDGRTNAQAD